MSKTNLYYCDCCNKEFKDPDYENPRMSIMNFKEIYNVPSMGNKSLTLGINGNDVFLCDECTSKVMSSLLEIGFQDLHDGCSKIMITH